ncbi:hypothetical protein Tco_1438050 [Tanacetum coccineum]
MQMGNNNTRICALHRGGTILPCSVTKPKQKRDSDCDESTLQVALWHFSRKAQIALTEFLSETHQKTVQNSNSSAQQDVLILSMFDQLSTQVTHCNTVNKALNTELDRYKEEVKDLKEMQNVTNSFVDHMKTSLRDCTVLSK